MATRSQKDKIAKVQKEFKMGKLRSGSKSGPKVTSPAQAKAIAMSEAGMPKPRRRSALSDLAMLKRKRMV